MTIAQSDVMLPGRIPFPGLDANRRYRVRPIPLGRPPSGLNPPPWWHATSTELGYSDQPKIHDWGLPPDGGPGLTLPGAALTTTGLMPAKTHPEQAIFYRADAID